MVHPKRRLGPLAVLCACVAFVIPAGAQEEPKVAGTDVPVPKRTKFVQPEYPAEAQLRGQRGIVILELLIDEHGKVVSVEVVRSIPPFDDAALAAVRKWEFEPTRVDGRPVRVRYTVPITFALKLPEVRRQEGIPELREGAQPPFPASALERGPATVTADLTLDGSGHVAEAQVLSGESPYSEALLQALRTWRFDAEGPRVTVSFRVKADFIPPRSGGQPRVELELSGLRRGESIVEAEPAAAPQPGAPEPSPPTEPEASPVPPEPVPSAPSPEPAAPAPQTPEAARPEAAPAAPGGAPTPPAPSPEPAAAGAAPEGRTRPDEPATASRPTSPPADREVQTSSPPPQAGAPKAPPAPPVEVIRAGPPSIAAAPLRTSNDPGVSALRDVTLGAGVPDLGKGRRPVVPPLARLGGVSGRVEVRFAVDAAGSTSVSAVEGPDLLKDSARETVSSWVFRRTSAERLRLVAEIQYGTETASAAVKKEEQP